MPDTLLTEFAFAELTPVILIKRAMVLPRFVNSVEANPWIWGEVSPLPKVYGHFTMCRMDIKETPQYEQRHVFIKL